MKDKIKKILKWLKSHALEIFILLGAFFFGCLAICDFTRELFIAAYLSAVWGAIIAYIVRKIKKNS